jgi:taurine--2-oxoglutarate transaminase
MCTNIGHADERVNNAILKQLNKVAYVAPTTSVTAARAEAGRLIKEVAPKNLTKVFFTNGGADANENAIKIARWYTGRQKVAARYRSYHGATAGAIALTGDPRRWAAEPAIPGVIRIPDFYPYRAGRDLNDAAYADEVLRATEEVLQFEGPHTVAAIILEPVVGTNGILIPSERYFKGMRALCTKYGILMICDEVMSGFCRTGEWFACQHWGVEPDMLSMAKGLTSAYVPLGAVMVSKEIADHFESRPLAAGLTYNSHSVGCAAAIACINVYKDDKILDNTRKMGKILKEELGKMTAKHPSIGDARSIGLFSMIEFVKDRKTREPLTPYNPKPADLGAMVPFAAYLREQGLFTFVRWNTVFMNPPLIINEQQLREGLAIIDKGIDIIDKSLK